MLYGTRAGQCRKGNIFPYTTSVMRAVNTLINLLKNIVNRSQFWWPPNAHVAVVARAPRRVQFPYKYTHIRIVPSPPNWCPAIYVHAKHAHRSRARVMRTMCVRACERTPSRWPAHQHLSASIVPTSSSARTRCVRRQSIVYFVCQTAQHAGCRRTNCGGVSEWVLEPSAKLD